MRARLRAAELNTSLSAPMKGFLEDLAGDDSEAQRHRRLPNELLQRLDALHQRDSSSQWGSGPSLMAPGCFLDTNVLLYAVSTDPGDAIKRELARQSPFTVQAITWDVCQRAGGTRLSSQLRNDALGSFTYRQQAPEVPIK